MTRKSNQFRHESLQDSKAIVRYLDALSEGFEKGTLQFRDQEGEIVLEPRGMIRFEVTASRKSGRYSMALKLSWKQTEEEGRDSGPLLINGEADPAEDDAASTESPTESPTESSKKPPKKKRPTVSNPKSAKK
jgi:amphi-Trp domain-containing protein